MSKPYRRSNTCLAVVRHANKLFFAGDRRISWNFSQAQIAPRPKVTMLDGILRAGTGTSVLCDEFTDLFKAPKLTKKDDSFMYVQHKLLPSFLKHLRDRGWVRKGECKLTKFEEADLSATCLVGIGTDLYELDISQDLIAVGAISSPFAAGCGGQLAWGALLALEKTAPDMKPEDKLKIALNAAAEVSPGCDSNIDIIHN